MTLSHAEARPALASPWARLAALTIDGALFAQAQGFVLMALLLVLTPLGGLDNSVWPWDVLAELLAVTVALALIWSRAIRTPGMAIMSLRIVAAEGETPGILRYHIRAAGVVAATAAGSMAGGVLLLSMAPHGLDSLNYGWILPRVIPVVAIALLPYAPLLWDPERRSLWDRLSGTRVIDAKPEARREVSQA
ncbi:MAG: RDD family protein [Dehalococcoidia bacterium]